MIKIEVTDPAALSPRELKSLGEFFNSLILDVKKETKVPSAAVLTLDPGFSAQNIADQSIAGADNPGIGAETDEDVTFREMAAAFGGVGLGEAIPNVPPVPGSASSPTAALLPVPVPLANTGTVELDAAGLPWDGRIHSSGKKKNKGDELWTAKRGVIPTLVTSVEAELRALMALPNAAVSGITPTIPVPVPATTLDSVFPIPIPGVSAAPLPNSVTTFAQLAPRVMAATAQGQFTHADVAAACKSVGLPNFPSLAAREDYVPTVFKILFLNGGL